MLDSYTTSLNNAVNQLLLIDKNGLIVETESTIFKNCIGKQIESLHTFFNSITPLLKEKNKTYTFDCININIDNKEYTLDAKLYTNQDTKAYSIFVFQDHTKQYINYQKAAQKKNEAEISAQLLESKNADLREKQAFKNSFIANFSNEIRMPVNSINEFISLLENTNLETSQRYNLKVIKNTNDRLKTMINDIIDISKIEAGHFSTVPIRYNLLDELDLIVAYYSQVCKAKNLELIHSVDPECPKYVILDKYRLAQIANNLVGNAIKFTPSGSIELKVKCISKTNGKAKLLFSVADTGIGIAENQQEAIFNGFYQTTNNLVNDGAGLGLAITKKLVKVLNGEISLESKVDQGTTFYVTLEFVISDNQKDDKFIINNLEEIQSDKRKILLADPSNSNKIDLINIIKNIKNTVVVTVDNGDRVIEELYKTNFDLLIINIKLPTMDGIDTTRYIRHSDYKKINKLPIMIVSEKRSKQEEMYCKERRANSYIGKPFNKPEILRKIKYILQKKQAK